MPRRERSSGTRGPYGNGSVAGVVWIQEQSVINGSTFRDVVWYAPAPLEPFAWPLVPLDWPLVAGASGVGHILYVHTAVVAVVVGNVGMESRRESFQSLDGGRIYTRFSGKLR